MTRPDDHSHCRVCGKVTDPGEDTCSATCRNRREAAMRSRRNLTYLMYGMIAFLLLILVVGYVR